MHPTIASQEKSRKCPAAMNPLDLVEGFFELPSDGTELFLVLAIAPIFLLWCLLSPLVRSLVERASAGLRFRDSSSRENDRTFISNYIVHPDNDYTIECISAIL